MFLVSCATSDTTLESACQNCWAFQETFNGVPSSPSQALLPRSFDYTVTHRSHPAEHTLTWGPYLADHGEHCEAPTQQHQVYTHHHTQGSSPDQSFFICNNHMMSSMGDLGEHFSAGYSVASFWPKQEFDFSQGGTLEFDVNINGPHPRSWFEILITPRSEMRVAAAHEYFPIDETYPKNRIVLDFFDNSRSIQVGTGAIDPQGVVAEKKDFFNWQARYPTDPANQDRRIRRKMRLRLTTAGYVHWSIQKADGQFDTLSLKVPGGLPFTKGVVIFKTHAYTPAKDGNLHDYTFHWDTIRFSGFIVGSYETFETNQLVHLQTGGDKPIGSYKTVTIQIPKITKSPVLFGQLHNPMRGQVLLSINGRTNQVVHPYEYTDGNCYSSGWKSFRVELNPAWLKQGLNTFRWTVGPRPACTSLGYPWNGFSVKDLEVQSNQ